MKKIIEKAVLALTTIVSVNSAFANDSTETVETKKDEITHSSQSEKKDTIVKKDTVKSKQKVTETSNQEPSNTSNDENIKWWAHDDLNYYPVPDAGLSNNVFCCFTETTPKRAIANTLPPTFDSRYNKLANSLPPTYEGRHVELANSLPPTCEGRHVGLANTLPPTFDYGKKITSHHSVRNFKFDNQNIRMS